MRFRIDVPSVREQVEKLVLRAALHPIDGASKRAAVVKGIADWLDERIQFRGPLGPGLEVVSDVLIPIVIEALVEEVYQRLKAANQLPPRIRP